MMGRHGWLWGSQWAVGVGSGTQEQGANEHVNVDQPRGEVGVDVGEALASMQMGGKAAAAIVFVEDTALEV